MRRELIRLSDYIRTNSYNKNNDVFNIIDYVQATCQKMYVFENSSVTTINESIDGVFEVIDKNRQSKQSLIGTGTGISKFDEFSGGLQSSDLIVIAGETSQGKTSLALTMAKNAAMNFNAKVVFYSLEMSKIQLTARLMAQETEVNSKRILVYPLNDETVKRISEKTWKLAGSSIYFDDNISTNAESIYRSIRMMSKKYGINIVVIDYLQLMSGDKSSTKEQQTGAIVNTLKSIAKDLNICVILLSQLSRSDSPEPSLRRLRDSGQIEQAADIVIFTYRPEVYGREYPKEFREFTPYDTAMIDVAKGRNIGITRFIVSFKKETTLYYDYDGGYFNPQQEKRPF
jgi:replicative DNA helicase